MSLHDLTKSALSSALNWLAGHFPSSPFAAWKRVLTRPPPRPAYPDAHYAHLPAAIRARLARLAARVLLEKRLRGLCWLVATFSVLLPLQGLWDWLVDLPLAGRLALLLFDLAIAGALTWYFWVLPKRPGIEECALRVERRFPEFRSSLISAVQFSAVTPASIVGMLFGQVEKSSESLPFTEVAPLSVLRRRAQVAGVLLALFLAVGVLTRPASGILLSRMILMNRPLPAATTIVFVTGNAEVTAGEDVRIEVRAAGRLPLSGHLEMERTNAPALSLPLARSASGADTYATSIQNVQQSFGYRVRVKGAVSTMYTVKVVHPPALASVRFTQHFPDYTRKTPEVMEPGNLALFAGSRLEIAASSTKPIRAAHIEIPGQKPIPLAVAGVACSGKLPVPASGLDEFSMVLQDADGVLSRNDTHYRVRIVPDEPPRVEWKPGGIDRRAMLVESSPGLAFTVSDDFMVTRVELVAVVSPSMREIRVPIQLPSYGPAFAFDEVIENPEALLPWEGGFSISYWIEAKDNNSATGPGVGRSSIREWILFTRAQKREELQKQLREHARRVKELSEQQKSIRGNVEKVKGP